MTIALNSPAGKLALPSRAPRRWVTLAPLAVLLAGMAGYTWQQLMGHADASIATPTLAAPVTLPVSTRVDAALLPTGSALPAAARTSAAGASPAAAPSDDAVPSLEDQELAAYHPSGD